MTSTKGTIKRLVVDKSFGFVADHDGGEYFFHHSACQPRGSMNCAQTSW
jgi:cold shock CspA family protein